MDNEEINKLKKELDKAAGDEEKQLLLDLIDGLEKQASNSLEDKQNLQELYHKVAEITELKTDKLISAVEQLQTAVEAIKLDIPENLLVRVSNPPLFPDEIAVSNFPEFPEIPEHPKEISLKRPDWFKQVSGDDLEPLFEELIKAVKDSKKIDLEKYREPERALAVRLSNGKRFIEALGQVISSATNAPFPFETSSGKPQAALVDDAGNLQVAIVSGSSAGVQYTEGDVDTTITGTALMWEDSGDTLRVISAAKPLPVNIVAIAGRVQTFEDTSFLTGDSPATLDVNSALGKNGSDGYIINDGAGNFTVAISNNGTDFGDEITMKQNEVLDLKDLDIDTIRITWISNSAYRVAVI